MWYDASERAEQGRRIIFVPQEGVVQSIPASLHPCIPHLQTDKHHIWMGAGEAWHIVFFKRTCVEEDADL